MSYNEVIDIIDRARKLFDRSWIKSRRKVTWKTLESAIDKAEKGEKLRWPFRLRR